jgi:hypothetical protein
VYEIRHASATHATLNCELGGRVISSLLTWAEVEAEFDVLADLFRSAGFECLRIKKTLHVLIGTAQQIDELFKHCCSTKTIQAGRIKGVQTLVGKRWTYLGGCFAGEKGRKYADIYELLPEGTKLRPVRYSYQGRMVSYRKQNYVLGQKVVACAKWWFRELERDHITSRVPAPNNPTSDRLQKIAQLEAECDRIQAEGEIAPANCWLERPPVPQQQRQSASLLPLEASDF